MAIIFQAELTPGKVDLLAGWIGNRRWYVGKGSAPQLRRLGSYRFDDPDGEVGIEVLVVADDSGTDPVVYQVPVTYRGEPLPDALDDALVGTMEHSVLGTRYVYDGCHDPVFVAALLRAMVTGARGAAMVVHAADGTATGVELPASVTVRGSGFRHAAVPQVVRSHVLRGEQSNTSVIVDVADDEPLIIKVFRVLHDGANPDVELQTILSDAGSERIAVMVGSLTGEWPSGIPDAPARGDLAFVQTFFPGVRDAWREALDAATADRDFSAPAAALGAATADVHRQLAALCPTAEPLQQDVADTVAAMRRRFADAVREVPELAEREDAFEALLARASEDAWPQLQRIHGDYHLGQVLDVPEKGWILLDFEGEPLRPLHERTVLDEPLRDVAGMLRSFDYAAGTVEHEGGGDRTTWAQTARAGFLSGYAAELGIDVADHQALLDAFEVDKACYEVVYEARNRPDWLPIPRAAILHLLPTTRSTEMTAAPSIALGHDVAQALLTGRYGDPHQLLGPHEDDAGVVIRVFRPFASTVAVRLQDDTRHSLTHEYEGLWSARLDGVTQVPDYRVITTYDDGVEHVADDPYRFLPSLGQIDLHLIGEGRHEQLWSVLGAHVRAYDGPLGLVRGTSFAVWAPNARGVRVVGDFNQWDGQGHPMRQLGTSGVWELFVPSAEAGTRYKFDVLCADDVWRKKADPMARQSETAPATASVVTESSYEWGDEEWLQRRASVDAHGQPMSIYEVHPMSWRQGRSYRELADELVGYVKELGFTHVEFMPVMEHPYPPSWGYHVTGYYAPNSRLGHPDDFRYLVDRLHQEGIGVILDWVPGHFATDEWALARFDGTALYEHPDRRRGWHPEWGSYIFDFGRPQVRNFLVANAVYWMQEFHADGLRVDGVASMLYLDYSRNDGEWLPNRHGGRENLEAVQLLQETNATTYRRLPGTVMIAEESTSWPGVTKPTDAGGLGFGFKWNMGWMHDSLDYVANAPIYRRYHHDKLTFALVYAWSEQFVLPISHDEVVHGKGSLLRKMPGNRWEQLAGVRSYLANMWSHPGKQLIFMGTEFAQESEWADGRSLDWWLLDQPAHHGVLALVRDLNNLYKQHPALWELDNSPAGFQWIDPSGGDTNTVSYLRYGHAPDDATAEERPVVASVVNFSGAEHRDVRVGLPRPGRWLEVLNTDAELYGGAGRGNLGSVTAEPVPWNDQPYSAVMTLPSLAAVWFVPDTEVTAESTDDEGAADDDVTSR
ncbi:1,4-alpha-glucan branching protein GlgB [Rudaeicoccus suwonensis]|uniref:1,4-alpha-glucan branching enzyme GlgB n=1 Tax=Rudaeicoccus suwonensis TaxID=657409 RepID=A0A561DX25_9MICO|nr:1,4-alpha-glucan branching protein GlgB [Rudaeicoccus suwonensis]TWE07928.1 1,4-alpha-glucan branching enzyme [Rudaeicoccus suwonensis]